MLSPGLAVNLATSTIFTANCIFDSRCMHLRTIENGPLRNWNIIIIAFSIWHGNLISFNIILLLLFFTWKQQTKGVYLQWCNMRKVNIRMPLIAKNQCLLVLTFQSLRTVRKHHRTGCRRQPWCITFDLFVLFLE